MFLPTDITLQAGDSGDYVRELQRRLAQRDLLGEANISGFYDGVTTQAVMEFQSLNGLRSDGIAGAETLRRLISIGASDAGSEGGGGSGEEEDKEKYGHDAERFDTFTAAQQTEAEQDKLANEAVWGYGSEQNAAGQQQAGQQQLSDLERYNQQHDLNQQQQSEQANTAMKNAAHEQLEISQQGMKAHTLAQDMEQKPDTQQEAKDGQNKQVEKAPEKAPEQAVEQQASINKQADVARDQMAAQARTEPALREPPATQTPAAPAAPRDPVIERTEAKLDAPSREESKKEGRKLDARGVRDNGKVPETELGDLSPARSPAKQREQEIGR